MATYHRQNPHANKKKLTVSYEIHDKDERYHRSGVNSLQYDAYLDRLYSGGRDSVIRVWNFSGNHDEVDDQHHHNFHEQQHYLEYTNGKQRNHQQSTNAHLNNRSQSRHQQHYRRRQEKNGQYSDIDAVETNGHDDYYISSFQHHSDWVNDIILSADGRHLLSVSNDTTMKVWDSQQGICLSTLKSHKDYAKCLAYSKDKEILASAGFDRMIYLWDLQVLSMLTTSKNTVTTKSLEGSKDSIYSLAINQDATLIASGSTEKVIRLWDPRSRQKMLKFRGHTDNVRSLLFSADGTLLMSASSDGTIRVWSIGQQRCINIIRVHDKGVWTLQADDNFNTVYSGGKDGKVYMTDLKQPSNTALVCQEDEPILKILLVNKTFKESSSATSSSSSSSSSLWVTTSNSTIKNWSLCDIDDVKNYMTDRPMNESPDVIIKGNPAVIDYHVLNDKRHVLTRESDNSIGLYDVLTAKKLETLHKRNNESESKDSFELEIKERFKMIYVPHWFTVDLKIGILCIHLEENDVFSAWVSAKDYNFASSSEGQIIDPKINLGRLMLQALFEYWPPTYEFPDGDNKTNMGDHHSSSQDDARLGARDSLIDHQHRYANNCMTNKTTTLATTNSSSNSSANGILERLGNQYFSIPPHTPIIISEGNQTIFKFLASQASDRCDDQTLQEIIPAWISDIVIAKCQPRLIKIPFYLLPHPNIGIKPMKKERLTASDMLPIRKVIEHVKEKMLTERMAAIAIENGGVGSPAGSNNMNSGSNSNNNNQPSNEHQATRTSNSSKDSEQQLANEKVELYCNDQKLDDNLDLRSVRHYIWKSGCDLVLHYIPVK